MQGRLCLIKSFSDEYNISILCEALKVAKGSYYNHILRNKNGKRIIEGVATYIHVYNSKSPHSVLMNRTPDRYESKYFSVHKDKSNSETEH